MPGRRKEREGGVLFYPRCSRKKWCTSLSIYCFVVNAAVDPCCSGPLSPPFYQSVSQFKEVSTCHAALLLHTQKRTSIFLSLSHVAAPAAVVPGPVM